MHRTTMVHWRHVRRQPILRTWHHGSIKMKGSWTWAMHVLPITSRKWVNLLRHRRSMPVHVSSSPIWRHPHWWHWPSCITNATKSDPYSLAPGIPDLKTEIVFLGQCKKLLSQDFWTCTKHIHHSFTGRISFCISMTLELRIPNPLFKFFQTQKFKEIATALIWSQ